jgi:hypothetical protein
MNHNEMRRTKCSVNLSDTKFNRYLLSFGGDTCMYSVKLHPILRSWYAFYVNNSYWYVPGAVESYLCTRIVVLVLIICLQSFTR